MAEIVTAHNVFLYLLIAFIAATFLESFLNISRGAHRQLYWFLTACASVFAFLVAYPNLKEAFGASVFVLLALVSVAYFNTPYIKVRGKIHAEFVDDSQPDPEEGISGQKSADHDPAPDSYSGMLTPAKMWWGMIPLGVLITAAIVMALTGEKPWWYALIGIVLLAAAPLSGYGDASWGYRIARGQTVPFIIVGIVTVGMFAVLYLVAYYAGKTWSVRRPQSMEYRAHPRHQRNG